ncbi:MAG: hypothetical protein RR646_02275 [Erysipelotrichaceae bacterium]
MESYVETIFITAFLLMLNSCMIGMYVSAKPLKFNTIILYAIINALIVSLSYFKGSLYFYIILSIVCMLLLFRNNIKTYIVAISTYILLNLSMYTILGNSIHLFTYASPINDYSIIIYWIIMIISIVLLHYCYGEYLVIKSYIYNVELCALNKRIKGYLDTGNLVMYNDKPIVFLDESYYEYYKRYSIQLLMIQTIECNHQISAIEAYIQIDGYSKMLVYISFIPRSKLVLNCSCLLNVHMIRG